MTKKLSVGDKVVFQMYNDPEKKFYGPTRLGEIVDIVTKQEGKFISTLFNEQVQPDTVGIIRPEDAIHFVVRWHDSGYATLRYSTLSRKEIKRRTA